MGNHSDGEEYRDTTATIGKRGRLTIDEDDRKVLEIHGERALLDMKIRVVERDVPPQRSSGDSDG